MNKSQRINDMMRFLSDKKVFQLGDIMERYGISKSTALRDIQSLEEMGMPLYSKLGRSGHYGILPNRLLSPIVFSMDEVSALYFSMQTLGAYQSTPFHLSIGRLKEKFESCISGERIQSLRKMEQVFRLDKGGSKTECNCLADILEMAVEEHACTVYYIKGEQHQQYHVQFFDITSAYGQWYATAYDFESEKPRVFRCDKIQQIEPCDAYNPKPLSELLQVPEQLFRQENAVDFEVHISPKGVDLFHKEHYPSMQLHQTGESATIKGFYNKGEERFIAGYFLAYGKELVSVWPAALKKLIQNQLDEIKAHVAHL